MIQKKFCAQVIDGRLQYEERLADLEGQYVEVTVSRTVNGEATSALLEQSSIPDWLDVENDIFLPMEATTTVIDAPERKIVPGQPCLILPEDFHDE